MPLDALDRLYAQLGLIEPRPKKTRSAQRVVARRTGRPHVRPGKPPAAPPSPRRRKSRAAETRPEAVPASPLPVTVVARVNGRLANDFVPEVKAARAAGPVPEKKNNRAPVRQPRHLGTGTCDGCRRRDQVLLESSEGPRCRVCHPDLEASDE